MMTSGLRRHKRLFIVNGYILHQGGAHRSANVIGSFQLTQLSFSRPVPISCK